MGNITRDLQCSYAELDSILLPRISRFASEKFTSQRVVIFIYGYDKGMSVSPAWMFSGSRNTETLPIPFSASLFVARSAFDCTSFLTG